MRIKGKQLADTLRDEDAPFSRVYASQLTGGLVFKAKNASAQAMSTGQAVYISGVSGEVPEVLLADADGIGTTPAAGLIATGGNAGAEVWIISLGELKNVNTSTFSEGDTLYVGTTAGALVASPPAGSSAKLQNIGRVVRADAAGVIFVGGAGRSAATPNLDQGTFFIGNASNQSSASAYTLPITDGNAGDVLTTDGAGAVTFSAPSGGATTPTLISANTSLSADTHYVVDPSITSGLLLNVPNSSVTDGAQIHVTNLSTQTITIELYDTSGQARLYYADGTLAPTPAIYRDRIAVESQGTIRLYQAGAGDPVEWYLYHSPAFEVEAAADELDTAQALAYNAERKAFVSAGEIHGEKILSANVASTVYPYHLYATAYDEATARTVSLPDRYNNETLVSGLDGHRVYFENRGTTTLTVNLYDNYGFQNSITYRAYLTRFDGALISGNTYTLQPGERVEVETEVEDVSGSDKRVYYRLGKHRPIYDTTTDTSGTNSTISHGREQHLTYIVDTANNVSVTLPSAASVKPSYRLTVKSIGAGTTTVSRAGTDTFDGQTSTDLSQYGFITLQRESSTTWSVVSQTAVSGGGSSYPQIKRVSGNYTVTTADVEAKLQIIYTGTADTWTVTLPDFSSLLSSDSVIDGSVVDSVEMSIARDRIGEITLIATNGVGLFNDGSSTYSTKTVASGEWVRLLGYLDASSVARWTAENDRALWTLVERSGNTIAEAGRYYQATASLTVTLRENRFLDGQLVHIQNTSGSNVTLTPYFTEKINGSTDDYILSAGEWVTLVHDKSAVDFKVQYASISGGGGFTYSAISSTTTAQARYHYSCDTSGGAFTLNLPALSGVTAGAEIRVKLATAGNDLTIDASGTETIDGNLTHTLSAAKSAITLVATGGTDWEII